MAPKNDDFVLLLPFLLRFRPLCDIYLQEEESLDKVFILIIVIPLGMIAFFVVVVAV